MFDYWAGLHKMESEEATPPQHPQHHPHPCKDRNIKETGLHILECKVLCNQSNEISYIPNYNDLFSSDIQEQIYVSRIMHSNMEARKEFLKE